MTDIKIIFEDNDILILDKPAGITVNRSDTTKGNTLQDWLQDKFQIFNQKQVTGDEVFYQRTGIVHRIDKETSGILIVAKNREVFENLQKQFKDRIVKKTYIALSHGKMQGEGEIKVPVGRLPWNRKRFGVLSGGRDAVTKYKVVKNLILNSEPLTLLELYPQTGRTHQIRVHLKYLNHPVFADELYAGRKTARNDRKILPRLFLHAFKISFNHPKTGEKIEFKSDLPKELKDLIL